MVARDETISAASLTARHRVGGRRRVTVRCTRSRPRPLKQEDSGRRIADALGLAVTEHDAPDSRAISPALLAECGLPPADHVEAAWVACEPWRGAR